MPHMDCHFDMYLVHAYENTPSQVGPVRSDTWEGAATFSLNTADKIKQSDTFLEILHVCSWKHRKPKNWTELNRIQRYFSIIYRFFVIFIRNGGKKAFVVGEAKRIGVGQQNSVDRGCDVGVPPVFRRRLIDWLTTFRLMIQYRIFIFVSKMFQNAPTTPKEWLTIQTSWKEESVGKLTVDSDITQKSIVKAKKQIRWMKSPIKQSMHRLYE